MKNAPYTYQEVLDLVRPFNRLNAQCPRMNENGFSIVCTIITPKGTKHHIVHTFEVSDCIEWTVNHNGEVHDPEFCEDIQEGLGFANGFVHMINDVF